MTYLFVISGAFFLLATIAFVDEAMEAQQELKAHRLSVKKRAEAKTRRNGFFAGAFAAALLTMISAVGWSL